MCALNAGLYIHSQRRLAIMNFVAISKKSIRAHFRAFDSNFMQFCVYVVQYKTKMFVITNQYLIGSSEAQKSMTMKEKKEHNEYNSLAGLAEC